MESFSITDSSKSGHPPTMSTHGSSTSWSSPSSVAILLTVSLSSSSLSLLPVATICSSNDRTSNPILQSQKRSIFALNCLFYLLQFYCTVAGADDIEQKVIAWQTLINDRLAFKINYKTKQTLCSLYKHCITFTNKENFCIELFDQSTKELDDDMHRCYSDYVTDTTKAQINDLRKRALCAINECKLKINQDLANQQCELTLNELAKIIGDIFLEISAMLDIEVSAEVLIGAGFKNFDLIFNAQRRLTRIFWLHGGGCKKQIVDLRREVLNLEEGMNILKYRQMKNDYKLLVREVFSNVKCLLIYSIQRVKFPDNYLDPIYDLNFDIQNLQASNSFLSYLIRTVADQFGLSMNELIDFLRIKKRSNATFHLNLEMKEFARRHLIDQQYDLQKFIHDEKLLINISDVKMGKLQCVFQQICRR
ncbi:unnamed protein product [Rotaria socialis]|uniref:Uncharacterized protein n=1 Tax=Rotaria socialis TaxID=392032 RepID=A0A817XMQ3_9BILA|nr:unnamed protein product [Rotaria socialis]